MNDSSLSVRDLRTVFTRDHSQFEAVRGVSLEVRAGQTLVLLGESGSGKSVTARSIMRLYGSAVRISGEVRLAGLDLLALSEAEMRRARGRRIALVPQDPTAALDPLRRIGSQIGEVIRVHQEGIDRAAIRRRVLELLERVGIANIERVYRSYPHQLSGGMRQRAVIAMAVSCKPELLIADEPTTALDVTTQAQILELIAELRYDEGTAVLMVTHDVGVASDYGDDVAVMWRGRIVDSGTVGEVLHAPAHPYTAGLLAAQPRPGIPRGELPILTWSAPDLPGETEETSPR